ncbi:hypothetical protein BDV93DRAFT_514903 [Ceratobasidium sp. AG-I]|nr:hypothetical protein BDV93DRAFT_514903 [Ceratobasidium sp. AG-I]
MMFNLASLISAVVLILPLAALTAAVIPATAAGLKDHSRSKTRKVMVGKGGKLYGLAWKYTKPTWVLATRRNTVTKTSFDNPCLEIDHGFDTGIISVSEDKTLTRIFKVANANPPKTGITFRKFRNNAIHAVEQ